MDRLELSRDVADDNRQNCDDAQIQRAEEHDFVE